MNKKTYATGHKCIFRLNIDQNQINDMLTKVISLMTKEGKFKEAIQDKIGKKLIPLIWKRWLWHKGGRYDCYS